MFSLFDDMQDVLQTEREIVEVAVERQPKKRRYFDFDKNYEECA